MNIMKLMIPFFYSYSPLSKHMVECIDYIYKTEVALTPELAIQVRAATFVNPKGCKEKTKLQICRKRTK